jgi:hypothetical protein
VSLRVPDEVIRLKSGTAPYRYLERIAICVYEGGLSEQEAHVLAARELSQELPPPTRKPNPYHRPP